MQITPPNSQLSTFLSGMGVERTNEVTQPYLWGTGERYGLRVPTNWEGPTEAEQEEQRLAQLERVRAGVGPPTIMRGPEGETSNITLPEEPRFPSREEALQSYYERAGNPDDVDPFVESEKAASEIGGNIKKQLGYETETDPKLMSKDDRKIFTVALENQRSDLYKQAVENKKAKQRQRDKFLEIYEKRREEYFAPQKLAQEEEIKQAATAKYKEPTTKRVWDTKLDKYVQRTDQQILKDPDRYGMTKEETMEMTKAGAPTITQQVGLEKFGLQKETTAGNIRTKLMNNKGDKNFYAASGRIFNMTNASNEIVLWDSKAGLFNTGQTKIIKLPKKIIDAGESPKSIQEFADRNGYEIEKVLRDLKVLQ